MNPCETPNCIAKKTLNIKDNILFILLINVRSIIGEFADWITNLILVRKKFTFIIITESWLTDESILVPENNGYKSRAGYFNTDVLSNSIPMQCQHISSVRSSNGYATSSIDCTKRSNVVSRRSFNK